MSTLRDVFFISFCTALLVFYGVLARPIQQSSEGRVGRVAQEMLNDGDWVVPHLNGVVRLEKPPFASWLVALVASAASALTGASPDGPPQVQAWHVYVPPGLATMLLIALVYIWMKQTEFTGRETEKRFDRSLFAAFVLATAPGFFIQARSAEADMLLALWVAMAFYGFWKHRATGSVSALLIAYAALGLSVLTKGHVGLVTVVPPLLLWSLVERSRSSLSLPKSGALKWHLAGVLLIFMIVLPWAIPFLQRSGITWQAFNKEGLGGRVGENVPHDEPFYWYLYHIPGWFLPWTLLLIFALFQTRRLPPDERSPLRRLCWIWLGWGVLLFSILSSKQRHYVVPLFPAAALIVADTFARWWELAEAGPARSARISLIVLSLLLATGTAVLPLLAASGKLLSAAEASAIWPVAILGALVFIFAAVKLALRAGCMHLWWAGGVCLMVIFSRTIENQEATKSPHYFCTKVRAAVPPEEPLYDFDIALPTRKGTSSLAAAPKPVWRAQVLFYLNRKVTPVHDELSAFLEKQHRRIYAIVSDRNLEGVSPTSYVILHREEKFLGHKNSALFIRSIGKSHK